MPVVADTVYSRVEILKALDDLGLTRSWLATRIQESKQNVHNWLDTESPTEPQDPTVWQKMTDAIVSMGRPRIAVPEEIRQLGIDVGIAILEGDDETARQLAPRLIRELSAPYSSDQRSRKKT